jgi:hypothetical protein
MRTWVVALLDPEPIEKGSREKATGEIATPPRFVIPDTVKPLPKLLPQPALASSTGPRSLRSASPAKSTPRKMASPRKRAARAPSAKTEAKADGESAMAKASKSMQDKVTNGNSAPAITGQDDVVRVSVNETVRKENDIETLKTSVTVDMPASNPSLPMPQSTEEIIAKAKEMVAEANKLEKARAKNTKRKASTSVRSESAKEDGEGSQRIAKKMKTGLEETLIHERVKTRALIGLTATIAIGYVYRINHYLTLA